MVLRLSFEDLQTIAAHAERTYPDECCGVMLGHLERQQDDVHKHLVELWAMPNAWSPEVAEQLAGLDSESTSPSDWVSSGSLEMTTSRRYWIDPADLLRAQRYARDRQIHMIGIYHSHPDYLAVPSECDRLLAWPQYSYVIASVQQGRCDRILSWSLNHQHQFESETMLTLEVPQG